MNTLSAAGAVVCAAAVCCALGSLWLSAPATGTKRHIKTVFVILMENHNWTGNDAGSASGDPDLKGSSLAPYTNTALVRLSSHAEQYFNPPGNHPSRPDYLWLEAGTNFGVLRDILPKQAHIKSRLHLVDFLQNAGVTWNAYVEPDYGKQDFADCPLDYSEVDVDHVPFVYFDDVTDHFRATAPACLAHVKPLDKLATNLASGTVARYNFITPNLCHDGHEGISPCDPSEPADNTRRGDYWLSQEVPKIVASDIYKQAGALFITWDEAEDSGSYGDGPIGLFG